MLPHLRRPGGAAGRFPWAALAASLLLGAFFATACDKMPLLAPSGTVINLFASSKVMPVNGTIEITATVIEQGTAQAPATGGQQQAATAGAGTPVHNGTLVTFTTTIGTIDPKEARTHNGQLSVRLIGDGRSGVAKVIAFSGGARSAELEISIGAAAVERVVLTASPQTVPASGGTIQLTARAEDVAGNALPGVPVSFTSTAGTIQNPTVITDDLGLARTSLTTNRDTDVTAAAGAKTVTVKLLLAARMGLTLATTTTTPTAGVAVMFSVGVAATANVRSVTLDFGDGSQQAIGSITSTTSVAHVYSREGTYTVSATAVDANLDRESVSTTVVVAAAPRPTITLTPPTSPVAGVSANFTVSVTVPANAARIRDVTIAFGDGASQSLGPITSATTVAHVYGREGTYTVTATAVDVNDVRDSVSTTVVVAASPRLGITISSSTTTPTVGQPVSFTVTVTTPTNSPGLRDVSVNFGDGTAQSMGPAASATVSHVYNSTGTYTASATATDNNGQISSANTQVVVGGVSVTIAATKSTTNTRFFTFTATVAPSTVAVDHYEWRFGDGTLVTTSGNSTTHIYSGSITGRTEVKVTVFPVSGPAVSAITEIDVG